MTSEAFLATYSWVAVPTPGMVTEPSMVSEANGASASLSTFLPMTTGRVEGFTIQLNVPFLPTVMEESTKSSKLESQVGESKSLRSRMVAPLGALPLRTPWYLVSMACFRAMK